MELQKLINEAHQTAVDKGWWNEREGAVRNLPEQIALMHSELSEALEEYRVFGLDEKALLYTACAIDETHLPWPAYVEGRKPEGIASEFADVLIRIFDTCGKYDIPLEKALLAKMAFNKTRPYRHGGKKS